MSQSLAKILLHVVFSTKDRQPFLDDDSVREELHRYLGGIINGLDGQSLMVGGIEDHVHLMFVHPRTRTVADVIKELKRGSSAWLKQRSSNLTAFAWQNGYGAFSIAFSQVDALRAYIVNQEKHQRTKSFQEEYRELLTRYEMTFDERYVWD